MFVRAEGIEQEERVNVTTHMTTYGLSIEAFTQSLCSWNVLTHVKQTKCTLFIHYCMNSNNEIKQCTASIDLPFQNLVKVRASCLHDL